MILLQLWQQEKDRLSDILFQRVTQNKNEILHDGLLGKGYPEFFEAALRRFSRQQVRQEKPIMLNHDGHYRFDDPAIKTQLTKLENTLSHQRIFTAEELRELGTKAINFQFETLVRPRQSLFERLYNAAESRFAEDILIVLDGYGEDRPYIQCLVQGIKQSESEEIQQVDFVTLSNSAERAVYKETPLSAFMTEVDLLLKFEGAVTGETHFVVRSSILMGLLQERGLNAMADSFHSEADSKEFWTLDEIENALERHILVGGFTEETTDAGEGGLSEKDDSEVLDFRLPDDIAIDALDAVKKRRTTPADETQSGQMDLLNLRFVDSLEEEADLSGPHEAPAPEHELDSEAGTKVAERNETDEEENLYPLITQIGPEERNCFVTKIFDGEEEQYLRFIERLETIKEWEQAKAVIEEELVRRVLDPYSEEAVLLGDIVYSLYHP